MVLDTTPTGALSRVHGASARRPLHAGSGGALPATRGRAKPVTALAD